LIDSVDSVINQTYRPIEIIIVDDGSTDETSTIAKEYCNKDSRIQLIEKNNGGLSYARNFGIQSSQGRYFIFLDADDYLFINCLSTIVNHFENTDEHTLIQYGYTYVSENKKKVLHSVLPTKYPAFIPAIFSEVPGPCHTICIHRKLLLAAGNFDESLKSLEDWDFWIRVAKLGAKQKTINAPLVYYRYVNNSMSRNAFAMYDAFKTVVLRAPQQDTRIDVTAPQNKNYEFNPTPVLEKALIRMMGVAIMQSKVDEAIQLFLQESTRQINTFKPYEFETMCSYLSFRYWYTPSDIKNVFHNIYPSFCFFFDKIKYNSIEQRKALFFIFKRHLFHNNVLRYGKIIGAFSNYLLRKKQTI
jgi:glycosyltransferase involved in cell wall biosynthesis